MYQHLFIALDLPQSVRESLGALQLNQPGLRTVPIDNLHLTLHFLGSADANKVAELVNEVATTQRPFEFHLSGVGYFLGRSNNLILWAGVEPNKQLAMLHSALGACLLAAGYAIEQRPYLPHVTLARGDIPMSPAIAEFLQIHQHYSTMVPATELCLYRSETKPDGPVYSVLIRHPLQSNHLIN